MDKMSHQIRLNRIEFLCNRNQHPEIPIRLDGYYIFSDNWITENAKRLINERTGEEIEILNVDYYTNNEWDNKSLIQYDAGSFREVKRTAIKTNKPLNIDDFYIEINERPTLKALYE